MTALANPVRGEAAIVIAGETKKLRPTFSALVAAESELGSLFALVERAGDGQLRIDELATLFWHCLVDNDQVTRNDVGDAIVAQGLSSASKPLRTLLYQILQGAD